MAQRGIQSIEVGGQLLRALAHHGRPMALKDLAREAGMAPAKAHPYLVSFGQLGLIEQDEATGKERKLEAARPIAASKASQSSRIRRPRTKFTAKLDSR